MDAARIRRESAGEDVNFLKWLVNIYINAIRTAPIVPMELLIGMFSVIWGLWLVNPLGDTFTSSTIYRAMALIGPEWVWGTAVFVLGFVRLYALYRNHVLWRLRIALAGYLLWGFISLTFALSNIWSTATPIYGLFAGCTLVVALRLREESKRYDA